MTRKSNLKNVLVIILTLLIAGGTVFGAIMFANRKPDETPDTDSTTEQPSTPSIEMDHQTGETIPELDEGNEVFLDDNLVMQLVRLETGVPKTDDNGNFVIDSDGDLVYTDGDEDAVNGILDRLITLVNHFAEKEYSLDANRQVQRFYFEYRNYFADIPVTDMCDRIASCIPASGSDPELLSAKAEEVFGFNRGDGYAFVFNSIPVSDISVQFCNIKPNGVELSDESESLCLYLECRNPDDDGYERNLEAWLHQIISIMKASEYTDDAVHMAQLLYAGSLCDAEYRSDWSDALLRCIGDGKSSFDALEEAVMHEFGVCIDYNALLIDYYAKG